jgi:hypothetical protein
MSDGKPSPPKVPRVIQEAGKAVERDIKPALRLMGRIFFNTWLGDQSYVHVPPGAAPPPARRAPRPKASPPSTAAGVHTTDPGPRPMVIDAELIEDCLTCGGSKKVGRPGHQVPCPSCAGK